MSKLQKVLVLASHGFIGANVASALAEDFDVYGTSRVAGHATNEYALDLEDKASIESVLKRVRPNIIINCAGWIENGEQSKLNPLFTKNLLEATLSSGVKPDMVVVCGSAAEYGVVSKTDLPVSEDAPLNASSPYGISKVEETRLALAFGRDYDMKVVVVRIFNAIGPGMKDKFLLPKLIQAVHEVAQKKRDHIEINRLDAERDYIDVRDVAGAIKAIISASPRSDIYNIGSGKATTNGQLLDLVIKHSNLSNRPEVIEKSPEPEKLVAVQADISHIKNEFGWAQSFTIEETIKDVVHASGK